MGPRKISLPLWYIVLIFVTTIATFATIAGYEYANINYNVELMKGLIIINWAILISWFLTNVIMLVYNKIENKKGFDIFAPASISVLYLIQIILIVINLFVVIPSLFVKSFNILSTTYELLLGGYLLISYFYTKNNISKEEKTKVKKRTTKSKVKKTTKSKANKKVVKKSKK